MHDLLGRRGVALAFAASLVALLGTSRRAEAYCRTTTEPLPASYSPRNGCFTEGLFLFWRNACVSYSVNDAGSKNIPFDTATSIIDKAFGTWMAATCDSGGPAGLVVSDAGAAACTQVRYNPDGANQNLIVFRDDGWPYNDPNNTLGLTTVTFDSQTGEIYDADMEINASGRNLSLTDQVPVQGYDLLSVLTHEAGHFLGLAHATDARSTMYASYKPGSSALRTLTADDVAGFCAIYPTSEVRVVSPVGSQTDTLAATACDPTPRHGLANACVEASKTVPNQSSGCAASPAGGSRGGLFAVGLAAAVGLFVRRRRSV